MLSPVAKVALYGAAYAFDKLYSYAIPPKMNLTAGQRVIVPFGRGNTEKQGIVFEIAEEDRYHLKTVKSVIDETPVLSEEMLKYIGDIIKSIFVCF